MLFADGDALPSQLPLWVSVILALGGVAGLGAAVKVVMDAVLQWRGSRSGERAQTIRQRSAQHRADRKAKIEDENRVIKQWQDLFDGERDKNTEADGKHREEVDAMEKAHAAETAELRREIAEVKDEHADCRVRVARLEEALRSRGWDFPEDTSKPATPPEKREPADDGRADPRH